MGWACIMDGGTRNAYRFLVEKPLVKWPFERPRRNGNVRIWTYPLARFGIISVESESLGSATGKYQSVRAW